MDYGQNQQPPPMYGHQPPQQPMQPMGQPMQHMGQSQVTNVVIQQPTAQNALLIGTVGGTRDWSSGLFGCCEDCSATMKALCCLDCMICGLNTRLGECVCNHYLVPGSLINLRTRTRTLGGIRGNMLNDCCAMHFCGLCAVCQIERELNAMGL